MGKIYLEGADNTRDLGGLKTTEGAVIKDKQLIRSNRLSRITQKDKILLETEQGMLLIKGNDLHVNRLSLEQGEVDVTGKIDGLTYSDVETYHKGGGESFLGRLFK